ncbi:hypothetical protein P12x_001330 [Tundrisphaera lichenicola]|uniref:hypothetical protein n=1 Tax=Tundrisphaera lichenicola TaxID=2029860 RepID=UPI003EBCE40B
MTTPEQPTTRGLRLHDLIGLVVGYGLAALLARSFWPRSRPLSGVPGVALGLEFLWLGMAMSGPIVLLLDRRGIPSESDRSRRPKRPGRLISSKEMPETPVGRSHSIRAGSEPSRFTRAELSWLLIGAYWIAFTFFVVPARSLDTPWALAGLLQFLAAIGLLLVLPRQQKTATQPPSWTHHAALVLLYTWPIAWIFLIVLSGSF